ncbi:MAG: trypsin-like serine protease [Pseudohongiellaceae bacterium]
MKKTREPLINSVPPLREPVACRRKASCAGNDQRFPSKLTALLAVIILYTHADAIIVRHDTGAGQYLVSERDYPAVFYLQQSNHRKLCAATLVHPRWAITAAHCVQETGMDQVLSTASGAGPSREYPVLIGGRENGVDHVEWHPDYQGVGNLEVDLALLRLSVPVDSIQAIPLYVDDDELGKIVTLLGWGYFGIGTTGREFDDGGLRRARNRITVADHRLQFTFDDPRILGTEVLALEGFPGLGDSGGPAFIESEGTLSLAGIAVGQVEGLDFNEETQGSYGAVSVYERISIHTSWINRIIRSGHDGP